MLPLLLLAIIVSPAPAKKPTHSSSQAIGVPAGTPAPLRGIAASAARTEAAARAAATNVRDPWAVLPCSRTAHHMIC